jgi:hypothetical protein
MLNRGRRFGVPPHLHMGINERPTGADLRHQGLRFSTPV